MSHQIHNYTELRQQIHNDLRIKYPEWVEPNGESSMSLLEVLDTLTRTGNQRVHRYSSCLRAGGKLKLPAHVLFYVLLAFAALALASPCQAQERRTIRQHNSTPQQALDKRQDAFQEDKAKGVHASYQWELSGPNGGDWWLIVTDGTYKSGKGKIHNPNVTFVASDEDWVAMSNKTLTVSWAYLTGRLQIQGSHGLVRELDKIFP
jgi:putative sterol carrier protein